MSDVFDIVAKLAETSSKNEKIKILKENKENEDLARYFFYCLDKHTKFGVKKIPNYSSQSEELGLDDVFTTLDNLASRKFTGNAAIELVAKTLNNVDVEIQWLMISMLSKNPKCGVNIELASKTWPELFPKTVKLCKAQAYSAKAMQAIKYPAYSQRKCDGERCLAVYDGETVTLMSSSGKIYHGLKHIEYNMLAVANGTPCVLDGELIGVRGDTVLSRKEGNGLLNKALHNTISEEEAKLIHLVAWDYIPYEDYLEDKPTMKYSEAFEYLKKRLQETWTMHISAVHTKIVNSHEEAIKHFREMLSNGEEGTILKNMDMKWEGKRSKNCVKMKVIIENTMEVIDAFEGKDKYQGKLGGFICKSRDGKVEVRVGSGLSDDDRKNWWPADGMIGKFIEVKSTGIIQAEDGTYSLFLPRYVGVRSDKLEADSFEEIVALSDGSSMLMED